MGTPSARIPEQEPQPTPPPPSRQEWRQRVVGQVQRRRRLLIVLAALLVLYTVFGFLVLPWIVRRQLEKRLTAALHRETTVTRVRTNPYALSVTIDGFLVKDPDGTPFISWDRLYVNLTLWRVVLRELALEKVALVRFHSRVAMDRKGRLNFQDLVDESSSSEPEPPPDPQKKRPLVFAVQQLDIIQAQLDFSDRSRRRPFDSTIGPFDIHLDGFRTLPNSTSPYSFAGKTESGETFSWAGNLLTEPLRSMGTITFDGLKLSKYSPYYEQEVGFEIRDGLLGLKTAYTFSWGPEDHMLRVADGSVSVRTLVLGVPGLPENKVELPEAKASGIGIDVVHQNARVETVVLRDAVLRVHRNRDGRFDLEQFRPPKKAGPPPKETKSEPFHWGVGKVELAGWRIELRDDLPARPASLTLAPIDLRLEDLADGKQQTSRLTASVGFGGKGRVDVGGSVKLLRPSADLALTVEQLELGQFDPYLDLYGDLAARLGSGTLGLKGKVRFDAAAEPTRWGFEGDTRIDELALLDSQRNQELARWKALQISEIKTASTPLGPSLSVRSVRWIQPRVRVALAEDGSSNLSRLLKTPPEKKTAAKPETNEAKPETTEAKPETAEAKPAAGGKPRPRPDRPEAPVSIASFQIVRGTATFADRSVTPPVTLSMTDLDVRLRGLSNALNARSQVAIKGLVSGGPLEVNGILSPRMVNDATKVKITSKGIDLTPLSPYCGKYAGYVLDKGKLDLELEYKVVKRKLDSANLIKVDQFTFGEATSSKDATKLPVKLGLAVLQDPNGLIEIDVPVEGNVDDPDFRLSRVVWRAIGNVLLKAVISPFNLLAKAFGGGGKDAKLDVIDFQAGAPDLTPSADKTLQNVSKALASRPALRMDIEGTTDPASDTKTLKLRELRRQAALAKSDGKGKGNAELTDDEYLRFVEKKYRALSPPATGGSAPDPAAMEDAVLATVQLPPEALGALGQARAEAARARLMQLGVDAGRVFLTKGGERAKKEAGPRVYFTLK